MDLHIILHYTASPLPFEDLEGKKQIRERFSVLLCVRVVTKVPVTSLHHQGLACGSSIHFQMGLYTETLLSSSGRDHSAWRMPKGGHWVKNKVTLV